MSSLLHKQLNIYSNMNRQGTNIAVYKHTDCRLTQHRDSVLAPCFLEAGVPGPPPAVYNKKKTFIHRKTLLCAEIVQGPELYTTEPKYLYAANSKMMAKIQLYNATHIWQAKTYVRLKQSRYALATNIALCRNRV